MPPCFKYLKFTTVNSAEHFQHPVVKLNEKLAVFRILFKCYLTARKLANKRQDFISAYLFLQHFKQHPVLKALKKYYRTNRFNSCTLVRVNRKRVAGRPCPKPVTCNIRVYLMYRISRVIKIKSPLQKSDHIADIQLNTADTVAVRRHCKKSVISRSINGAR